MQARGPGAAAMQARGPSAAARQPRGPKIVRFSRFLLRKFHYILIF